MTATFAPSNPSACLKAHKDNSLEASLDRLSKLLVLPLDLSDRPQVDAVLTASLSVAIELDNLHQLPPGRDGGIDRVLAVAETYLEHTASGLAVDDGHLTTAMALGCRGSTGLLAKIFAAPAWQLTGLKPLADAAPWLWPLYARYLLGSPEYFATSADEAAWSGHHVVQLEAIARMLDVNRGSSSLRTVASIALQLAPHWPFVGDSAQIRRRQQALGKIVSRISNRITPFASPSGYMPGIPLTVGVVDSGDTAGSVFSGEQLSSLLDNQRIRIRRFSLTANDTLTFGAAQTSESLPATVPAQVSVLRQSALDALVFAGDVTDPASPLSQLAAHRSAPVQFITGLSAHSSGHDSIDIWLAGPDKDSASATERIGRLPANLAFDVSLATDSTGQPLTRSDLGLPEGAAVYVATVEPRNCPAALRAAWNTLLDNDADARLVLLPAISGSAVERLMADIASRHGERILTASATPLEDQAVATLLRVSDRYLTSPSVCAQRHAAIARRLGIAISDTTSSATAVCDPLTYAECISGVVEQACELMNREGAAGFAKSRAELTVTPPETTAAARRAKGRRELDLGRPDRAVVHLMAALDQPDVDAEVWHDLALALQANQQLTDAISALETCVRLAPDRLDAWLLLADWAEQLGHTELVQDIAGVVQQLAPDNLRVISLVSRFPR